MRYVVLHHTAWPGRPDHYDLLLQAAPGLDDDARILKAFATLGDRFPTAAKPGASASPASQAVGERPQVPSARGPADQPVNLLRRQRDHRRRYLRYEGPVSGGRGRVARVDEGSARFIGAPDELTFRLAGARLRGMFRLRELAGGLYALERAGHSRSPSSSTARS
jgi:hypothetical protein